MTEDSVDNSTEVRHSQMTDQQAWAILFRRIFGGLAAIILLCAWGYLAGISFLAFGEWLAAFIFKTELRAFITSIVFIVATFSAGLYGLFWFFRDWKESIKKEAEGQ